MQQTLSLIMYFELTSTARGQLRLALLPLVDVAFLSLRRMHGPTHLFLSHPSQRCGTQSQRERGHRANIQSSHIWIPGHSDHRLVLT
jgi:hypothetical protein